MKNSIITTYFRSSSYGTHEFCPLKFFCDYTLGYHSPANHSASKGSVVHKALELLARKKLAQQNGETSFVDETFGPLIVQDVEPDAMLDLSYKYYEELDNMFDWKRADYTDCKRWMWAALNYKDGMFSPLKRHIVMPEQYFDFIIEEPWAVYDYELPNGDRISGHLGIKGTMDLMTRVGDDYEMIDWKTGRRWDWNKNKEKTYEDLMKDPQLLLYYYAARRLYPDVKNIYVTIFFLKSGGPYSLCFGDEHIELLKQLLRDKLNELRNTVKPKRIYPNRKCDWCYFSKHGVDGPVDKFKDSLCETINRDIIQLGIGKVMDKYSKDKTYSEYGSGGGRRHENKD